MTGALSIGALASAPAALAATPPADHLTVKVAGTPAYSVSQDVSKGGISLIDGPAEHKTNNITGQATLTGGAAVNVNITRSGDNYSGTFSLVDSGSSIQANATVTGNSVTRVNDNTVTWVGSATVKRGTATSTAQVTFTVVDGIIDPGAHVVTLTHAGQVRTATVIVPAGKAGVQGLPAVVHFPGLGENALFADYFSELAQAADKYGYIAVIPEHYGVGWQGVPYGTSAPPDLDDIGYVQALLPVVEARFGVDPKRIYSSGMSNGSWFSQLTACKLSNVFAAFAAVSGPLDADNEKTCNPGRHVPMLIFHGTTDPLVPYSGVAPALAFWAKNNGCSTTTTDTNLPDVDPTDNTTVIKHVYNNCPADGPVVFYQIIGGGHNWPGGMPFLPFNVLGGTTQDINANQIIWDFASQYSLK